MKSFFKILLIPAVLILLSLKSDMPAYQYFDCDGEKISYQKMLRQLSEADIIFFGEQHDNSIAHWMELELAKDLVEAKGQNLIIGAEMFEADGQLLIDEYIGGKIMEKIFMDQARLWPNYKTDYSPILKLALENKLKFVATNIPRRYASLVNYDNFFALNNLSDEAKQYIAPLPIKYDSTVACYKSMADMMSKMSGPKHTVTYIAEAQAIKDAIMAYFILKNLTAGKTFYHFNGSYHSDNHEGIVWWIKQQRPDLKIMTISTVEQDSLSSISDKESLKLADFILAVDKDITKTH